MNLGNFGGGCQHRFWTLDPIDGTEGFLNQRQYAICLALIIHGSVELGVLACPNLPCSGVIPDEHNFMDRGCILHAIRGHGAFQEPILFEEGLKPTLKRSNLSTIFNSFYNATFCESYNPGHSDMDAHAKIAMELGLAKPSVKMDSQCKYAILSRGDVQMYFRLPRTTHYEEKIWVLFIFRMQTYMH